MSMFFFKLPKLLKKSESIKMTVDFDSEKFENLLDDALRKCMSVGGKSFENHHGEYDPHIVAEAMCWKCGHRWIATYPVSTLLKHLECPNCNSQGFAFLTNQDLDATGSKEE